LNPRISVFLPVRNGEPWIREALESLLSQTLPPMEILVGDDASEDRTVEIVEAIGSPVVRVYRSESRIGISRQCNALIEKASGRYLARMDADDIALPDKFRLQLEHFSLTDTSVLGTWALRFGKVDQLHKEPVDHNAALAKLGLLSPFVNPSVIFDRDRLGGVPEYDPEIRFGGDYDCFQRLKNRARFGNLPEPLLLWRLHDLNAGVAPDTHRIQSEVVSGIRQRIWETAKIRLTRDEKRALDDLVQLPLPTLFNAKHLISAFEKGLNTACEEELWAPKDSIRELFWELWDYYCQSQAWGNLSVLRIWWKGNSILQKRNSPKTLSALFAKAILKRSHPTGV
jgi:glycosyltransferase involved in cell wall biosynthesis